MDIFEALRRGHLIPRAVKLLASDKADANRITLTNAAGETVEAVWIQVAREGTYKGHASGAEFTLDAAVFAQVIANFRNHPSYAANDGGIGTEDVIAFDFHHESEMKGTNASATVGAPAQAWALDLEVRQGPEGLELWALTRYLEPARTYVREGRYKWTSVALWPHAKDPVTAANIGWYLSSIAFTNDPFIQGMQPIAASARPGSRAGAPIELGADHVLGELRWIFGLSEVDGLPEIAAALAELRSFVLGGATPPTGVDVTRLVGKVRSLLNLPLLTPDAEVFSQADAMIAKLNDATPSPPDQPETPAAATVAATRNKEHEMDPKLIALAGRLGVTADTPDAPEKLAAAVSLVLEQNKDFRTKFAAIAKALGVENADEVLASLGAKLAEADELRAALPELEKLRAQQGEDEEEVAQKDVMAAMRVHGLDDRYKPMIAHMRTGGVELPRKRDRKGNMVLDVGHPTYAECLERRRAARQTFLEEYPIPDAGSDHLLESVATAPSSPSFHRGPLAAARMNGGSIVMGGGSRAAAPAPGPGAEAASRGQAPRLDLSRYAGRNVTEQAMAYIREQPGGDALPFEQLHEKACAIVDAQREAGALN